MSPSTDSHHQASNDAHLPQGFEMLEPFVQEWVLSDSRARSHKRLSSDFATLNAFYQAILPHAPAALAYLSDYQLGALDAAQERLLKLLLSLAEIGPAIEWYGQPAVIDGFDAARFELKEQLPDNQPQEV